MGSKKRTNSKKQKIHNTASCMLWFDPLKYYHDKAVVKRQIVQWLRSEWDFFMSNETNPFVSENEEWEMCAPKVSIQNNYCDCGVFVCLYAMGMMSILNSSLDESDHWLQ